MLQCHALGLCPQAVLSHYTTNGDIWCCGLTLYCSAIPSQSPTAALMWKRLILSLDNTNPTSDGKVVIQYGPRVWGYLQRHKVLIRVTLGPTKQLIHLLELHAGPLRNKHTHCACKVSRQCVDKCSQWKGLHSGIPMWMGSTSSVWKGLKPECVDGVKVGHLVEGE